MSHATHRDYAGAKLGMWLFLFTEMLLFGGLFILYAVYLHRYPAEFAVAGHRLDLVLGTANTAILLTSSLLAALAVTAVQRDEGRVAFRALGGTIVCAGLFLVIKYAEWSAKIGHGIYPGSPDLAAGPPGESVFFGLYYLTTGLHGLHVLIGGVLLAVVARRVKEGRVHAGDYIWLENGALYWHLVDLVWIFIFPLYYLML
ncbi:MULTISPECIES: cytochrome c oxidase subunit 3 family protein [Geobacter]|uniref:Cytochrome C oxidase subunit III n=2 Tax=Geobacter TaxID=28231 RepID=A0A0C1R080_9BACT|nr:MULTISPECIES: cytochrome c oxidase subunit 3 family protein [Geobacter]KIE43891.1 cytochrome C oxidase subunit III [Geobacter soli]MBE2889485.1 cytochrome c oxidase subunit 3 family protein [Geobacter anodireducens]HMN01222.1 cytochrome c oxidase subunit 3 family protein [Geobacter anodireducens]